MSRLIHVRFTWSRAFALLALLTVTLTLACEKAVSVTHPTPIQTTATTTTTHDFDLSPFVGVWELDWRVTVVEPSTGGDSVAQTMQSQIGVPSKWSLTVTNDNVILTNPAGDWVCTFPGAAFDTDSTSFKDGSHAIYFSCQKPTLSFKCNDGTTHELFSWAGGVNGVLTGAELTGISAFMFEDVTGHQEGAITHMTAQFTGRRK